MVYHTPDTMSCRVEDDDDYPVLHKHRKSTSHPAWWIMSKGMSDCAMMNMVTISWHIGHALAAPEDTARIMARMGNHPVGGGRNRAMY